MYQKGDALIISGHTHDGGVDRHNGRRIVLRRPCGLYRVLFVFQSGKLFCLWIDETDGPAMPQVIDPIHVITKKAIKRVA